MYGETVSKNINDILKKLLNFMYLKYNKTSMSQQNNKILLVKISKPELFQNNFINFFDSESIIIIKLK